MVWVGWQQAIARLGLADLESLVETAFACGWVCSDVLSLKHFREDLRAAREAADPADVFPDTEKDSYLDDLVGRLSTWASFQPEKPRESVRRPAGTLVPDAASPARNPYRDVGRNDPCPCGSGKKFKKCCLGKAA
jgi:hypothetical protein